MLEILVSFFFFVLFGKRGREKRFRESSFEGRKKTRKKQKTQTKPTDKKKKKS